MLPELVFDVLCFLNRDDLDRVEITTKALMKLVETHFDVYALRNIWRFTIY